MTHRATARTLYKEALHTFDWHFEFSDDPKVYQAGHAQLQALRKVQKELDPTGEIWMSFKPKDRGCPYPVLTTYKGFAASATGDQGAASATSKHSVALGLGYSSRAKAPASGAIVLVCRDYSTDEILHIRASKVGANGILADTWYVLDQEGNFAVWIDEE